MATQKPTPDVVLKFDKFTDNFLCPLSANVYNIQFLSFKIRDCDSGVVLFEVSRDPLLDEEIKFDDDPSAEAEFRTVRYHFGPNFFKLKTIGTSLVFSVGNKPVKNFRMIERHYFKEKLIHSYDFSFPFCMPDSTNTWESIYTVPPMPQALIDDMIASPWQTKSDSFYFVGEDLVMHNKAEYNYSPDADYGEEEEEDINATRKKRAERA